MNSRARLCPLIFIMLLLMSVGDKVLAQTINALAECRAQSLDIDQIHNCMDRYLDVLDDNLLAITDYLDETLSADALAGLNRSQQAFVEYRRQNCLWYLDFSSPRADAEQIAKNCLATMSRQRLTELQELLSAEEASGQLMTGFYVYGVERNSFQPCGSEQRYWVEGDLSSVGLIQQTYLSVATDERQLLHATLIGNLDEQIQAPEGHQGIISLENLVALRVPTESDCQLPAGSYNLDITSSDVEVPQTTREVLDDERAEQDEPEQQLIAYFGAWLVDCVEFSARKSCSLEVALTREGDDGSSDPEERTSRLTLNRTPRQSTFAELDIVDREIDSPALIRWQVDSQVLGDIVGSEIRVDQAGTRQLISESKFFKDDLLPMMVQGRELKISVLDSVDDVTSDDVFATLDGLTKALEFADDFVRDSDQGFNESQ